MTIDYTDEKPVIDTILMSIQHDDDFDEAEFKKFVKENIMDAVVKKYDMNTDYRVLINPTGRAYPPYVSTMIFLPVRPVSP